MGRVTAGRVSVPTTTQSSVSIAKPMVSAVRQIAKSVVRRETETKQAGYALSTTFNGVISGAGECYPLVPPVSQGTDDYQRIGDRVKPKYIYVKGYVQYELSALSQPYIPAATCRIMMLSQKNVKATSEVSTRVDTNHLLKDNVGSGTGRAYVGGPTDNLAPINKELFNVHMDKRIKFNWQNNHSYDNGGLAVPGWQVGNDRTKYFTARIKCPATFTYDTNTGNTPNNFAPFFCFGATCDDGSAPWSATAPFKVVFLSTLYYEDA